MEKVEVWPHKKLKNRKYCITFPRSSKNLINVLYKLSLINFNNFRVPPSPFQRLSSFPHLLIKLNSLNTL